MIGLYSRLAQGGAGLIVTGGAYVDRAGQTLLRQTAIESDDRIPGLKRLTDKVHEYGAKIAIQLSQLVTPFIENNSLVQVMTMAEIERIIALYGLAAVRAREAGFDAVQLHAAHGYLFSQFLSPRSNRRTDQWGGNLENRVRFHTQVTNTIRQAVGQDYPLLIKLGTQDTIEGGLTLEEGCSVAQELSASGIDAIEVSEGLEKIRWNHIRKDIKLREEEAYYAEWAKEVKKVVNVPIILVGGMRSFDIIERMVHENYADCISICRPFIREPDIVHRWQTGNRKPAKCISCNLCLERTQRGESLQCFQEAKLQTDTILLEEDLGYEN